METNITRDPDVLAPPLSTANGTAPSVEPPAAPTVESTTEATRLKQFDDLFTIPPEELEVEETEGSLDAPEVGGPGRQAYFRVHPSKSLVVPLLRIEATGEFLLCSRGIDHPDIADYRLHLVRTKAGKLRLWPIRLPQDGDDFKASRQARAIAADAVTCWTAMRWKGGRGGHYLSRKFPGILDEPRWPAADIRDLTRQAFEDNTVTDSNDPRLLALPRLDDTDSA